MKNKTVISAIIFGLLFSPTLSAQAQEKEIIKLKVPFTSEVPLGSWVKPWNNACEEASMVMAESYYFGNETMTKEVAVKYMTPIFAIENKIFGGNADTDAARTAKLLNDYLSVSAAVKTNPTVDQIKDQLRQGKPVIAMLYMKNLLNKYHHFRAGGSYYHVLIIIGFDDNTGEFITNDNGNDVTGAGYRFKYDDIMKNLRDFNHKTKRADGPARVIFTDSKVLMKDKTSPAVYYIFHDTKFPIANSQAFFAHGWKWNQIKVVETKTLQKFKTGTTIES